MAPDSGLLTTAGSVSRERAANVGIVGMHRAPLRRVVDWSVYSLGACIVVFSLGALLWETLGLFANLQ